MYGAEEIKKRYGKFGGTIRHVLPTSISKLKEMYDKRELAIANCDAKGIMMNLNAIVDEKVSSFLMAMDVRRSGERKLRTYDTTFISVEIRLIIQRFVMFIPLEDRITVVMRNDTAGKHNAPSRFLY